MTTRTADDLAGLSMMLAEFACGTLEFGLLASQDHVINLERADLLSILSKDREYPLTGHDAYGMEDSMAHVAGRIGEVLAQGATIRAGEVAIAINDTRPFIHAYRPTLDTLTIETGGTRPAALLLIVDRERGAII